MDKVDYFVHLRRVDDKDVSKDVRASQVYELATRPPFDRCRLFNPQTEVDFVKNKEYGLHEGKEMVKYFIIFMTDSKANLELKKKEGHKRFKMPVRKSVGSVRAPFSDYKVIAPNNKITEAEKKDAAQLKKTEEKKTRAEVKSIQDMKILEKHQKINNDKADDRKHQDENENKSKPENPSLVEKPNELSSEPNFSTEKFVACDACGPAVEKLQQQLDLALRAADESAAVYEECKKERDIFKKQVEQQSQNISEINKKLTKLPDQINASQNACWLNKLKAQIVPISKKFSTTNVPEGSFYVGYGLVLEGEALGKCADPDTTRKRVEALCDAFFKEELPFMSPSGKRDKYGSMLPQVIKIQEVHYNAMRAILLAMPWKNITPKEKDKNTMESLKASVRKYTMAKCVDFCKEKYPEKFTEENEGEGPEKKKKKKINKDSPEKLNDEVKLISEEEKDEDEKDEDEDEKDEEMKENDPNKEEDEKLLIENNGHDGFTTDDSFST